MADAATQAPTDADAVGTKPTSSTEPNDPSASRARSGGLGLGMRRALLSPCRALARRTFGTIKIDIDRRRRGDDDRDDRDYEDGRAFGTLRLKAYRRMALDAPTFFTRRPQVDLAAGVALSSLGELEPKCRLKVGDHIRLKLFPTPSFQYKQLIRPHPTSKFVLETRCVIPFECFDEIRSGEIPRKAYVGARLRNDISTGLHLTSRGIELDERVDVFGPYGTVRAAVEVDFPTDIGPSVKRADGPPLKLRVNKLQMTVPTP